MLFYLRNDFIKTQLNFDISKYKEQFLINKQILSDQLMQKVPI
jgi:hypothetical protein